LFALLQLLPAALALVFLLASDGPVELSEAARDLGVPCEEDFPGGASLLELSGLSTQPLPLGFEARGVWLAEVFPSEESFVEAVTRVRERSSGLVTRPPTELWALRQMFCSLVVEAGLPDASGRDACAGARPAAGAVVKVCNIPLHSMALATHMVELVGEVRRYQARKSHALGEEPGKKALRLVADGPGLAALVFPCPSKAGSCLG
jgi:hypothetical protein